MRPGRAQPLRWSGAALTLVNLLPGRPPAPRRRARRPAGAISADGSRVYFTDGGNLYLRDGAADEPGRQAASGEGGRFQTASADGSLAFFTKAGHLYRYVAADRSRHRPDPRRRRKGVLGASADGSYLYYQTAAGLFLWPRRHRHRRSPPAPTPRRLPAGHRHRPGHRRRHHLAFLSTADLTGYDNRPQPAPEPEVYLYAAPAPAGPHLRLLQPDRRPPARPLDDPRRDRQRHRLDATHAYKPRAARADGNRLFFDSPDPLVAAGHQQRPRRLPVGGPGRRQLRQPAAASA